MQKNDGSSAMPVSFDVHRSRTDGCSKDISLHLYTPLLAFASQLPLPSPPTIPHTENAPK
jgi:hypothetical protein